jgi:uncharacterized membrane protein
MNSEKRTFKSTIKSAYQFVIVSMNGMVYGLFATLIIGVILNQIGLLLNFNFLLLGNTIALGTSIINLATFVKSLMGIGIGIGIGMALKFDGLKLIASAVAGGISTSIALMGKSDPMVSYLTVVFTMLALRAVFKKKSPLDIILIPMFAIIVSYTIAIIIVNPISSVTTAIGAFVNRVTEFEQPFLMGMLVSVLMGMILTSPFSSAAIAISFQIGGIAGGAALVGCCVNMLGFAVMGRKDNDFGTTISVAIGTSMLQFKNVLKKPIIWLPPIIVSAILGPFSTLDFKTRTDSTGAGMGTSGFVGQFATYAAMGNELMTWLSIVLLHIVLPIILVFFVDLLFRRLKLYGPGDLKI